MKYAKLSELKAGDDVYLDGGFTCRCEGKARIFCDEDDGKLFFKCDQGNHFLDGQCEDQEDDTLIGISKEEFL